jgi:glycosyltransferase involved in cell wall biosynthesis
MKKLSVVIITQNEEVNLPRCLESVNWADEIVVVDSGSTDRTEEIAAGYHARIHQIPWQGFGAAKQAGVDRAANEWILSIDADEAVSDELAEEIKQVLNGAEQFDGYLMPRRTCFLGRWILHCGWYPDPVLRLFRKSAGQFDGAIVHERVALDGTVGRLKGELLHYSYPNLESYFEKFNRYTTMGAEKALRQGKTAGWFEIVVKPPVSFVKHYVSKQGFRDGLEGFILSVLSAVAVLAKYAKLRHLVKTGRQTENDDTKS